MTKEPLYHGHKKCVCEYVCECACVFVCEREIIFLKDVSLHIFKISLIYVVVKLISDRYRYLGVWIIIDWLIDC